jgi:cytochrome c553
VSDEALFRIIADGKGAMPGTADVLTAHEVRAVIAFARVLSPGYELYNRFCAYCHGFTGQPPPSAQESAGSPRVGKIIPTFDETYFRTHTSEEVRAGIQHMRKQNRPVMPHFAGQLTADEISDIVTYLRTLPPESWEAEYVPQDRVVRDKMRADRAAGELYGGRAKPFVSHW